MIIIIPVHELTITPEWSISRIIGVSIDYMDSTVHAVFQGQPHEEIIIRLKDYGITLDNRFWGYKTSFGEAGLYLELRKKDQI